MTEPTEVPDIDYRLPRTASPRRYELTIAPDLGSATFTGEERIEIEVHQPVRALVLNAMDLSVTRARLSAPGRPALEATMQMDAGQERLTVWLPEEADPGTWYLELAFSGPINDKLAGFYRSTFTGSDGRTHVIAATQFEATDARRAFPCWDEPDRKAFFSVTLVVARGMTAISNAAVVEDSDHGEGRRRVRFADTMKMSTYLVAFVVGPLELTDAVDVGGVPLRIAHVPGKAHLTAFALEVGAHALRFFSDWFAIDYPGDKLDLIALPDFAFGAMENLGAVTFRESVLLVDPASASRVELERVADVVCHEIAHMWFGDLVTMSWWNGLWLNEAFATFMEILCVDAFRPEWRRWVSFGRSRAAAFAIDGLASTRPVEYPVRRPEEAQGMFDVLTYEKGASVLRMLERYLGTQAFRDGIRRYLSEHLHGNAETTDLWDAIEAATGEPVRAIMESWILQGGYPLVGITAERSTLRLDQRPFRYSPPAPGAGADAIGTSWQVPVLLRARLDAGPDGSERSVDLRLLLEAGGAAVELEGPVGWVVANATGSGFYRVHYQPELLARLSAEPSRLDSLERFNLLSDAWASVLAGHAPLVELVGLLRRTAAWDETDPDVWSVVVSVLSMLDRIAAGEDRPLLQSFARSLLAPAAARVGWVADPTEDERQGTLRAILLSALGTVAGDPATRQKAGQLHAEAQAGGPPVPPDLAQAVVSVVAATGGPSEYEAFLERFRHPSTPQEELRYLYALADFEDDQLVGRTLEMALTEVRSQNAPFVLGGVLANRQGGPAAWAFISSRWAELVDRFPDNTIPRMLHSLASLVRPELAGSVREFFASHPLPQGQRSLDQTLERLEVNLALMAREGPGLAQALTG